MDVVQFAETIFGASLRPHQRSLLRMLAEDEAGRRRPPRALVIEGNRCRVRGRRRPGTTRRGIVWTAAELMEAGR